MRGDGLSIKADVVDRHRNGRDPVDGEPARGRGRVDGEHPGDGRRVVGHVEAGAEADLKHLAGQVCRDAGSDGGELVASHGDVGEAGQDPVSVQAHGVDLFLRMQCSVGLGA